MSVKEHENIYRVYVSSSLVMLCSAHTVLSFYFKDVYNKIDSISLEQVDKLAREDHTAVISCEMDLKFVCLFCNAYR